MLLLVGSCNPGQVQGVFGRTTTSSIQITVLTPRVRRTQSYEIEYSYHGFVRTSEITSNSFSLTGLPPATVVKFTVTPKASCGKLGQPTTVMYQTGTVSFGNQHSCHYLKRSAKL